MTLYHQELKKRYNSGDPSVKIVDGSYQLCENEENTHPDAQESESYEETAYRVTQAAWETDTYARAPFVAASATSDQIKVAFDGGETGTLRGKQDRETAMISPNFR